MHFFNENRPFCVFEAPLGDLGATYDDRLRLIGKRVVNFLFLRAIIGSKSAILLQRGPVDPKFQVEGVAPHQPFLFSENWLNYLSYGIKICTDLFPVLLQFTRVTDGQTDRRTDGRTDGQNSHRYTASALHAAR